MKTRNEKLLQIMKNEANVLRSGNTCAWFKSFSYYHEFAINTNEENILDEKYEEFSIIATNNSIKVYGLREGQFSKIFEFQFNTLEWMETFYISIQSRLEYRSRAKTLRDLFEKTPIPIIQYTNPEAQLNIIRKTRQIFKESFIDLLTTLSEIDNLIMHCEAELEALIFNLYELSADQAIFIMKDLRYKNELYIEKVINFMNSPTQITR